MVHQIPNKALSSFKHNNYKLSKRPKFLLQFCSLDTTAIIARQILKNCKRQGETTEKFALCLFLLPTPIIAECSITLKYRCAIDAVPGMHEFVVECLKDPAEHVEHDHQDNSMADCIWAQAEEGIILSSFN